MALLDKLGHSVRLAENGQEAVNYYKDSLSKSAITSQPVEPLISTSTTLLVSTLLNDDIRSMRGLTSINNTPIPPPRINFDICLMDISMPV